MTAADRSTLLAFCRSLPLVTEDVKWGNDLVFSIGGKMFAGFDNTGKDATFGCKVPEEDFEAITSVEGIKPAAYAARFHWISVTDPNVLPKSEALALLRGSYELVKAKLPAKLQKQIDGALPAPKAGAMSGAAPKKATAAPKKSAAAPKKSAAAPKKSAAAPKKSAAPKKAAAPKKGTAAAKKRAALP
jgi:predicted DNA-binding protein (MmcQ/YjbR family)